MAKINNFFTNSLAIMYLRKNNYVGNYQPVQDTLALKSKLVCLHETIKIPFCSTGIRRNNASGSPFRNVFPDPFKHSRFGVQVVNWDIEKALNLRSVKVHRDDVVRAY